MCKLAKTNVEERGLLEMTCPIKSWFILSQYQLPKSKITKVVLKNTKQTFIFAFLSQ